MITKRHVYNALVAVLSAMWIVICVRAFAKWPWLPYAVGVPAVLAFYWWMHTWPLHAWKARKIRKGTLPRAKVRK